MAKQTFTTGQVLSAAQVNALQANDYNTTVSTKTASYVLVAADVGTTIVQNVATANTVTVNTGLFAAGDTLRIQNIGAGIATVTAGTATVNTASSLDLPQWGSGILYFTSTSAAIFFPSAGAAAAGGGFTLLSTLTLSSASTVQFLDINQTYKHLKLIWRNLNVSTAGSGLTWGLRINNVSATDYNTSSVGFGGSEVSPDQTQIGSTSQFGGFFGTMTSSSSGVEQQGFGSSNIWNYTDATNHQVEWQSCGTAVGVQNAYAVGLGVQVSSTAITRLDIVRLAGSSTINGTVQLWGVN
jgi:hypothetical protein